MQASVPPAENVPDNPRDAVEELSSHRVDVQGNGPVSETVDLDEGNAPVKKEKLDNDNTMEVELQSKIHQEDRSTSQGVDSKTRTAEQTPGSTSQPLASTRPATHSQPDAEGGGFLLSSNQTHSVSTAVDGANQTQSSMETDIFEGPDADPFKNGCLKVVDVTRSVRLPPEFGSLEVGFRITAGDPSDQLKDSQKLQSAAGEKAALLRKNGVSVLEEGTKLQFGGTQARLQQRMEAVEHFLSTLDRFDSAQSRLGRLPSPFDIQALETAHQGVSAITTVREHASDGDAQDSKNHQLPVVTTANKRRLPAGASLGRLKPNILQHGTPPSAVSPHSQSDPYVVSAKEQKMGHLSTRHSLGTIDSGHPLVGQDVRGPLTARHFTGLAQSSSSLVMQIPPPGSQIGVSSVPAIAPPYYAAQHSSWQATPVAMPVVENATRRNHLSTSLTLSQHPDVNRSILVGTPIVDPLPPETRPPDLEPIAEQPAGPSPDSSRDTAPEKQDQPPSGFRSMDKATKLNSSQVRCDETGVTRVKDVLDDRDGVRVLSPGVENWKCGEDDESYRGGNQCVGRSGIPENQNETRDDMGRK